MARAGRKRKEGRREASGRLQRPTLAQIAAAQRGIETALKINGLLDIEGASQQGAPAIVVTVGPDEEAERLGDDDLGTERPKQPAALS